MKLSFEDQESLKEVAGSLCFNTSPSDPDLNIQQMGSSTSSTWGSITMPPQGQERGEDN